MKKRRIIALLLAAALLILNLAGCTKTSKPIGAVESPKLADLLETDTLVVYVMKAFEKNEMHRFEAFQKASGVNVEFVYVDGDVFEYTERIVNDLASGSGPDILFLSDSFTVDITKAALNGNFLDLTDILAEDPEFSEEDYVAGIFEACQVNGRQYSVPLSYDFPFVFSLVETMNSLGFSWDGIDTMSDFFVEIARLTPKAEENLRFKQMLSSKNRFVNLLRLSGIRLLDYENGKVLPEEEALREFLEAYKAYFPYDYDWTGVSTNYNRVDPILDGSTVFWISVFLTNIVDSISLLKIKDCDYVYHTIPSQTGEVIGRVATQIVIPTNARNSANAYRFVKYMLSEEIQMDSTMLQGAKPIHKGAIHKVIYETPALYENYGYIFEDPENVALTEKEAKALEEAVTGVDCFVQDVRVGVVEMVQESMLPYFQDEASYEDCLSELRNKLTLYLSE